MGLVENPYELPNDFGAHVEDAIRAVEENKKSVQVGKVVDLTHEKAVQTDTQKIVLTADLHGNQENLAAIQKDCARQGLSPGEATWVILGDAVHPAWQGIPGYRNLPRDEQNRKMADMAGSITAMDTILQLKAGAPQFVYYLVGNHDNPHFFKTAKRESQNLLFLETVCERYGADVLTRYIEFLDKSPVLFVADGLVATHGGPVKGKNLIRLLSPRGLLSGLKQNAMPLDEVDPREFDLDPDLSVQTELVLGMHRGYIPNRKHERLRYAQKDVGLFLEALKMHNAHFVVGHDHDFDRPEEDPDPERTVFRNFGYWAKVWENAKHCILFSGGLLPGYAVFDPGTGHLDFCVANMPC